MTTLKVLLDQKSQIENIFREDEVTEELEAIWNETKDHIANKCDNYIYFFDNSEKEIAQLEAWIDKFKELKSLKEKEICFAKQKLNELLMKHNIDSLKGLLGSIKPFTSVKRFVDINLLSSEELDYEIKIKANDVTRIAITELMKNLDHPFSVKTYKNVTDLRKDHPAIISKIEDTITIRHKTSKKEDDASS